MERINPCYLANHRARSASGLVITLPALGPASLLLPSSVTQFPPRSNGNNNAISLISDVVMIMGSDVKTCHS